jgi:riboflavin kinase/FMN adenylyltransferase
VVALGTFDGVHLGHKKIISHLLNAALEKNLRPILVTFFPHPSHVLTPHKPLKLINSIEERVKLLKNQGIDAVYVQEFTKEFSQLSAQEFVEETLIGKLHMKHLIIGYDHSFGRNKEGNLELLTQLKETYHFDIERVEPYYHHGELVSSTVIRKEITKGNFDKVNDYLGYPFCLFGKVIQGNQLGRKIGFHTANIALDYSNKIIPKEGVYVVKSKIDNYWCYGMMNIGFRPTVDGKTRTIEAHYFDLDQDLYYQKLRIKILHRLRDELKFESLEMLKNQLMIDEKEARAWVE